MRKYENVFFDLDGTLINSYKGIAHSLDITFAHMGKTVDRSIYTTFIGPPMLDSLLKHFNQDDAIKALEVFREHYLPIGAFEYELYDGIEDIIKIIKEKGYNLYLATSKREAAAVEILADCGLLQYFDRVFGAGINNRKDKSDVLEYAYEEICYDKEKSILIGDTLYDVEGAKIVGIDCYAVLYGFGDNDELMNSEIVGYGESSVDVIKFLENC